MTASGGRPQGIADGSVAGYDKIAGAIVSLDAYRRQRTQRLAALLPLAEQLRVHMTYGEEDVPVSLWPVDDR